MEPLVLTRADVGFGRIIIDDDGVTRTHAIAADERLRWDGILDYRLTVELTPAPRGFLNPLDDVHELVDAMRANSDPATLRYGIELIGDCSVTVDWHFAGATDAIRLILARVQPRFSRDARDAYAATGEARFGDLVLTETHVCWRGERVPNQDVERIDLIDDSPVAFRIMLRDRVRPFMRAALRELPNLLALLDAAHALGHRVDRRGLLDLIS